MSNTIQSCLTPQVLEKIERNDLSPHELNAIEDHVSECPRCRELFDSHYTSSQWSELIQPALSEAQVALTSVAEDGADHSAAILKLLGPTDDPNMLGRIGNYEIVGVIGQGGMGAVFKGFDRSLNRFVAIKMLLPHLAASGAARKRFAREGQAVAAVVDDHVMAIHCVDQWQGIPYLVMTYSRGVSLQKRLNDSGPLELREILRIGMQAAKGLAAAHAQGIVHRDIKPSNILLDQNVERVQLVDFGLARAVDDASLTCSGTLAGTPQYMSPEQARAEAVDHRSDLFSLGSVLYAMCAGYAPFRADSSYSVLRLIIEKEPRSIREINSDTPDWLCAMIGKLMSKSPDDRYASADEVATMFKQCLAHVQDPVQHPLPSGIQAFKDRPQTQKTILSKLQRWFPIMNDKRIVSLIALILLLMAILVPWPIATIASLETSVAFFVPAALLSFGLALLSRSEYFSRIVLWIFGTTLGVAIVAIGIGVPILMHRYSLQEAILHDALREAERASISLANEASQTQKPSLDAVNVPKKNESQDVLPLPKQESQDVLPVPQQEGTVFQSNRVEVEPSQATSDDPLAHAIDQFNNRIRNTILFHDQPPLTKGELVACATWHLEPNNQSSETLKAGLAKIAIQNQMPDNWTIEGKYLDLQPDLDPVRAFQIYLQTDSLQEQFVIRRRFLHPLNSSVDTGTKDQAGGTSLAIAIQQFKALHADAGDQEQQRLSVNEVVAAILHETRHEEYAADESGGWLFDRFQDIARTRQLPEGATIQKISTVKGESGAEYKMCSIGIAMFGDKDHEDLSHMFEIRRQFVSVDRSNGLPVPDIIAKPTFPEKPHGNLRIQDAATFTSKPTENNGRSAKESTQELCSILGIAEPRTRATGESSADSRIEPSEEIVALGGFIDALNRLMDPYATETKSKLAWARRRMVDLLKAQVEFDLTQFLLDNPVWLDQVDTDLSEEAMETLRQRASEKLNELRSAAQKAALDTDLQEQRETEKSESVVIPYPMKFVSSQKAQATITNTSRLFGLFPEMPASDVRTNMLIIEKNGREKYFTCLAETLDRSSQEHAMSFDERTELWKNRLLLLAMLKIAVGAEN